MNGVVSGMSADGKRIKIEEEWYSVFAVASMNGAQVGDTVKFAYIQKESGGKVYNNIRGTVTVSKGTGAPAPSGGGSARGGSQESPERSMAIIRQNALTNAVQFFNARRPVTETTDVESEIIEVIQIAEAFAKFSSGEYERNKEAMESVEKEAADVRGRALDKVARSVLS
jgi:hypothetical protein